MFVCTDCHDSKEQYTHVHFSISYGKCEDCGKTADCFDCNCHKHKEVKSYLGEWEHRLNGMKAIVVLEYKEFLIVDMSNTNIPQVRETAYWENFYKRV